MIIGLDAKRAFNNTSGLGNYSRDVIRSLAKKEDVNLFLYTPKIKEKIWSPEIFSENETVSIIKPKDAINRIIKPYWRSFSIAKNVQKDHLDLYHGLSNEIPLTLGKMCKTAVTIHDLIFKRYPQWYKWIDRQTYDWKFKRACVNADQIIAISEQTKSDIIEYYNINPKKIKVIYQTCNDAFKSKVNEDFREKVRVKHQLPQQFLLNVGTVEARKNAFDIVRAIHQHKIDIPLVVLGRHTAYSDQIHQYIAQHRLEKQILMLTGVSNEELPAVYQMSEAFVYPSTFEGFGIPIIEALYSSVPVVSSTGGCFSEAGGSGSVYIDSGNIDALADAIKTVLSDSDKRKKMVEKGLEHVKNFDREKVTQELINLYQHTIHL